MITKEELKPYGKVETCEVIDDKLHVKITDGFKPKLTKVVELSELIVKRKGNRFRIVDKFQIDENLFHLILIPKDL